MFGLVMCTGEIFGILHERYHRWSFQARGKPKRQRVTEKIHGQEEIEMDDPLWRPLTGPAERRKRSDYNEVTEVTLWLFFNQV